MDEAKGGRGAGGAGAAAMARRCRAAVAAALVVGSVAATIAACGDDASPPPGGQTPGAPSATQVIGAAGGTLTGPGGASVTVPANAVAGDVAITMTAAPNAPAPAGVVVVGTAVTLAPEGQTFAVPVTVSLSIDPSRLPAGRSVADVRIYTAPAGSSSYTELETRATGGDRVAADTSHFSTFLPGVRAAGGPDDAGTPDSGVDAGPPVWTDVSPSPRPTGSKFAAVSVATASGELLVVAGSDGLVWTSSDKGVSWDSTKVDGAEGGQLASIAANGSAIWAAPVAQYAYRAAITSPLTFARRPPTDDAGVVPAVPIAAMMVTPSGTLHAGGGSNTIMQSTDQGETFASGGAGGSVQVFGISADETTDRVIAVGLTRIGEPYPGAFDSGGVISSFVLEPYGRITGSSGSGTRAYRAVWLSPGGPAFIAGDEGLVVQFSFGGSTSSSSKQLRVGGPNLRAIHGSGTTLIAVGASGTITRSTNGGTTWTDDVSGSTTDLHGVVITPSGEAYAVGDNGTVLRRIKD